MQLFRKKTPADQLDLLDANRAEASQTIAASDVGRASAPPSRESPRPTTTATVVANGLPLFVPIASIDEDPSNPRTEFSDAEIEELAEDIRRHGILQPIVVHPATPQGRYRIHFGAKRWRAARRAGLTEVPVVMRDAPADPYAQVAENQKRHGLTPLDLARFIRSRVASGESHTTIAKRLGMDLSTVTHHLTLLDLPPEVEATMKSGRCTSPRTLHELSKLHREAPEQVRTLLDGDGDITRAALKATRGDSEARPGEQQPTQRRPVAAGYPHALRTKAELACTRLERALDELANAELSADMTGMDDLKKRLSNLVGRLARGRTVRPRLPERHADREWR